ncbi:FtsX-like permease family protein [uncultured Alistipes sp.]|uniref:FtsX-like permease family protein n=1 Tax=uncultured Alistipes sp. TaxID=538949 RepID=UPI002600EAEB|nr:FtsX-like permease family protein [uncultured Alistipes sp.]
MLPLLFSRRYLFSKKSHSVINIISGVSVFAVAMPVAAMIILLSVFNGFEELVKQMASTFDADLTVTPREGERFPAERIDTAALACIDGLGGWSYTVEQNVLLEYRGHQAAATLRGADDRYPEVMPILGAISAGDYQVRLGDYDRAVLGQALAYSLGVRSLVGEPLKIYALRRNGFSTLIPLEGYSRREVDMAGVFQLDSEAEQQYLITSLRLARELFDFGEDATALLLRVDDPDRIETVKREVEQAVGREFEVRTRYELRRTFYDIMIYEKWGIFFISLLVLVIASFSMVGALSMLIIEKRKDVRTLRALGADTRLIRRIFIGEGVLIGSIGAAIGTVTGVTVTLVQQLFGIVEIPVESLVTRSYPVLFQVNDLLAVLGAFALVVAAVTGLTVYNMIPKNNRQP